MKESSKVAEDPPDIDIAVTKQPYSLQFRNYSIKSSESGPQVLFERNAINDE